MTPTVDQSLVNILVKSQHCRQIQTKVMAVNVICTNQLCCLVL